MNVLPPFLTRLGLDASADEREIRRTYARLLKAIDRAVDPAAFQSLHEAFESAKQWASHQARLAPAKPLENNPAAPAQEQLEAARIPEQTRPANAELFDEQIAAAPAPAPAGSEQREQEAFRTPTTEEHQQELEPPAKIAKGPSEPTKEHLSPAPSPIHFTRPQPEQVNHEAVGNIVFNEFLSLFMQHALDDTYGEQALKQDLEQTLNDPRLLNLQARTAFERHIGQLLVSGWRPGHHMLFDTAAQVFHWMDDSRRLDALGDIGPYLNRALMEYAVFQKMPANGLGPRKRLIDRLRDPRPPETQEVASSLNTLESMIARFPNWLRLVTNVQNIAIWRQGAQTLAAEIEESTRKRKIAAGKLSPLELGVFISVVAIVSFLIHMGNSNDNNARQPLGFAPPQYRTLQAPPPTNPAKPDYLGSLKDGPPEARFIPVVPRPTPLNYSDKQIKQIVAHIQANLRLPPLDQSVRNDPVRYTIEVTSEGSILKITKTESSLLPAFDDAVKEALNRSQPYPKSADQVSHSYFSITAYPRKK